MTMRSPTRYLVLSILIGAFAVSGCRPDTEQDARQAYGEGARTLSEIDDSSQSNPLSTSYRSPSDDNTEIVGVPETGIDLGWGWDQHNAAPVRTICVEFVEASEPAQTRYMTMKEVSDSYELMQSMGMSAQASVKTIAFEVRGKAAFAKETNITGYSSHFVMNATVENGVRYTAPAESGAVQLTETALKLATSNLDEFEHQCGDGFVSAVYAGAKLTALITVETKSQSEKEQMSATLSGSGWGAEFEASMQKKSGSKTENKNMSVSIFQTGGRGDAIPKDKQDLLDKLEVLPAIAFDAPKDFHMAVTPYDSLANWPAQTLDSGEEEFEQLASYWGAYNTLYDEIQHILDNPTDFAAPSLTEGTCVFNSNHPLSDTQIRRLEQLQDDVLDALHRIENFARHCTIAEEGCKFPEHLFRSPFAYRAQLPLEIYPANSVLAEGSPGTVAQQAKELMDNTRKSLQDIQKMCAEGQPLQTAFGYCRLVKQMLENIAPADKAYQYDIDLLAQNVFVDLTKRRCQNDRSDPLCMSNSEIDAWRDKMTYEQRIFDDLDQRNGVLKSLGQIEFEGTVATCQSSGRETPAVYSAEPGFPAIWYHPSIRGCVTGDKKTCPQLTQTALKSGDTAAN